MCSVIYPLKNKRRNVCAAGSGMAGSMKEKRNSGEIAERRYVRHERQYGEKIQEKN